MAIIPEGLHRIKNKPGLGRTGFGACGTREPERRRSLRRTRCGAV